MRFFVVLFSVWLWCLIGGAIMLKLGVEVSTDIQFLSIAIVTAGALAGSYE
jgi:hypothetical protein